MVASETALRELHELHEAYMERFAPAGLANRGYGEWWNTAASPTQSEIDACILAYTEVAERAASEYPFLFLELPGGHSLVRFYLERAAGAVALSVHSRRLREVLSGVRERLSNLHPLLFRGDEAASVVDLIEKLQNLNASRA